MLDSTRFAIADLCIPNGPVPFTVVGTLYGTPTPHLVLRSASSFILYAVHTLAEFEALARTHKDD